MHFRRTAMREVELRGKVIREGDKVVLWHISANRDEEVFEDPFRFDIERDPNDHIAFGGGGAHYCLGTNLARMELRLIFREVVTRMKDIRLDGDVERLDRTSSGASSTSRSTSRGGSEAPVGATA